MICSKNYDERIFDIWFDLGLEFIRITNKLVLIRLCMSKFNKADNYSNSL